MNVGILDAYDNPNVLINCEDNLEDTCIDLHLQYTVIPSTDIYRVESTNYAPLIPFDQGTALTPDIISNNNIVDDRFSDMLDIGFPFCFFDQPYEQLSIGSNGIITFNQSNANAVCPAGIPLQNPNPALVTNSIFAIQTDLIFDADDSSEIYYSVIGTAPCRKFIINFYQARLIGCDERTTYQLVLHETTNQIQLFIESKPLSCSENTNIALIGILNDLGDLGISPPDRNTGEWSATQEAWTFLPDGNNAPTITWTDAQENIIGYGEQINVCPTENTTYSASITYASCANYNNEFADSIDVLIDPQFPFIENSEILICDSQNNGEELLTLSNFNEQILYTPTSNFNISYYTNLSDAQNQISSIANYNITAETTLYVRIENNVNANCFIIRPIRFVFASTFIHNLTFEICDNYNDGIEQSYPVYSYIEQVLSEIQINEFTVHTSYADANNLTNPITNYNVSAATQFWLSIPFTPECAVIYGPFQFNFIPAPDLPTIPTIVFNDCDINSDDIENYDWPNELNELIEIPSGIIITAHETEQNAIENINPLETISEGEYQVYIRAENQLGCYNIYPVLVNAAFTGIEVTNLLDRICYENNEDITIDLNDYYPQMVVEANEPFTVSFFETNSDANNNENPISNIQTITPVNFARNNFYVRFQTSENCYSVKVLSIFFIHPTPLTTSIEVCDTNNDNIEQVNLSIFYTTLVGNTSSTITYYTTLEDAENNTNAISDYTFNSTNTTLYASINQYDCVAIYPIDFQLIETDNQNNNRTIEIENSCIGETIQIIDLNYYYNDIYTGDLQPIMTFYANYNSNTGALTGQIENVSTYEIENNTTIYAFLNFEGGSCNRIVTINLELIDHVPLNLSLANLYNCDFEQDLNEMYDLRESISQLVQNIPNFNPLLYNITYYNSQSNAETENNPLDVNFIPNAFIYTVYVRFQNQISSCYDIGILQLNTLEAPKIFEGNYIACDTNNNGMHEIYLSELISIVNQTGEDFSYTYFLNENDALDQTNEIIDVYENATTPTQIWVRAENIEDCYGLAPVNIIPGETTPLVTNELTLESCDFEGDGFEEFDLTQIITALGLTTESYAFFSTLEDIDNNNPIADYANYINTVAGGQTIYIRVDSTQPCPGFAAINLILNTPPQVILNDVTICQGEEFLIEPEILDNTLDYTYEWYNANNELISTQLNLQGTYPVGTYTFNIIPVDRPDCLGTYNINLSISEIQMASQQFSLTNCDRNVNGIQTFDLSQISNQLSPNQTIINFYAAPNLDEIINDSSNFTNTIPYNQSVYALIQADEICPEYFEIQLSVLTLVAYSQEFNLQQCNANQDGTAIFNLTQIESQLNSNQTITGYYTDANHQNLIPNPQQFTNTEAYNQVIYALMNDGSECDKIIHINLTIIPDPQLVLDNGELCPNGTTELIPELLNPNSAYIFQWTFNDQIISNNLNSGPITQMGTYQLNILTTIGDCSYTFESNVEELQPIEIIDLVINSNNVRVIADGIYPMEYSLDGENWQSSPNFQNLPPGVHQFYVRYIDLGCISEAKGVNLINVYNVITPNGDGINDKIVFPNLDIYNGEKSTLTIYNRYGKQVYSQESDSQLQWDGKINGSPLPSNDYWYIIDLPDGQKLKGHITLKNN